MIKVGDKWWARRGYGFAIEQEGEKLLVTRITPWQNHQYEISQKELRGLKRKSEIMALFWRKADHRFHPSGGVAPKGASHA